MADPVLPGELRARLTAAAKIPHPGSQPDEGTASLAAEVRAAGGCANIGSGSRDANSGWRHKVCILDPDHLGYHESTDGALWSLDRMELERRAELHRARARDAERRLVQLLDALYPVSPPTTVDDEVMHAAVQQAGGLNDAIRSFERAANSADRVRALLDGRPCYCPAPAGRGHDGLCPQSIVPVGLVRRTLDGPAAEPANGGPARLLYDDEPTPPEETR